jgi:hypothetical protein
MALFDEVRKLAKMLGFSGRQLAFHQLPTGEGDALVEMVRLFVDSLSAPTGSQSAAIADA